MLGVGLAIASVQSYASLRCMAISSSFTQRRTSINIDNVSEYQVGNCFLTFIDIPVNTVL